MLYLCRVKPLRHYLRGFLIAAWAGDKIAEFSFPEISFHFSLRPWFFFVSPAYAGKSKSAVHASCCGQDHPRVCGEKAYKRVISGSLWGSPPRMRGKASGPSERRACVRITPAYAGKRLLGRLPGMGGPDHPRACGEKTPVRFYENGVPGSPPRMRGKGSVRGRGG